MLIRGQATLMLRTVGWLLQSAVIVWFVSFFFASRHVTRPAKSLRIFCMLLSVAYCSGLSILVHRWLGLHISSFHQFFAWIVGFATIVWTPMLLLDLAPVGRMRRGVILTNALGAPAVLALCLVLRTDRLAVALSIVSFMICAGSLLLSISGMYAPNLRKRGLVIFAGLSGSGLVLMAISFAVRTLYGLPLIFSFGARATIELAKALMLTGTVFAFLHMPSADVFLLRIVRFYLWIGIAFGAWLAMQGIPATFPSVALRMRGDLHALLSLLDICAAVAAACVLNTGFPYLVERCVFGSQNWGQRRATVLQGLDAAESEDDAKEYAVYALKNFLGTTTVWLRPSERNPLGPLHDHPANRRWRRFRDRITSARRQGEDSETLVHVCQRGDEPLVLGVSTGLDRPGLLASEQQFLSDTGRLLEARLQTMLATRERIERTTRESLLRSSLIEAELRALRAQVDPHFLFNALNSIAELTVSDPQGAENMTLRLAETFRYVLTHADKPVVTLREELRFADAYIAIQKERFADRLVYSTDLPPELLNCEVPTLILQPLLENAMKFGIAKSIAGGSIRLSGLRKAGGVELRIINTNYEVSVPASRSETSTGIGLSNVRERLRLVCGSTANLTLLHSDERNAEVVIFIPYQECSDARFDRR